MDKLSETIAEVRGILKDWENVSVVRQQGFWLISGTYAGKFHAGVPVDPIDGAKRLDAIAKQTRVRQPQVSEGLAALLQPDEELHIGKARLLKEYNSLTQKLLDDKYVMVRSETDRHEAISAILLELRR